MIRTHWQVLVRVKKTKRLESGKTGSTIEAESGFLFSLRRVCSVQNEFDSYISLKSSLRALEKVLRTADE